MKKSPCASSRPPFLFVTPRAFRVHVRGDLTSSDLRGMNVENLSMLKSGSSFVFGNHEKTHRDQTKVGLRENRANSKEVFQDVDPKVGIP